MKRIAFRMSVNPEMIDEYRKRHNPIWRELEDTFYEYGVKSYSIFLDERDGCLFACAEVESVERWNAIAQTDVCKKWWEYMKDLMPSNADNSPKAHELNEVFHIEESK